MKTILSLIIISLVGINMATANTYSPLPQKGNGATLDGCDEHPTATKQTYSVKCQLFHGGYLAEADGKMLEICFFDDNKVVLHNPYFSNFDFAMGDLEATIDDTGLITIPMGQIVYSFNDDVTGEKRDIYAGRCFIVTDEYGNDNIVRDNSSDVYTLQLDAETGIITSTEQDVYMFQYEGNTNHYNVVGNIVASPWVSEEVVVPEDAVTETFAYTYTQDGIEKSKVIEIASVENEYYIKGLLIDDAWVKGTLDGTMLNVASYQFQGIEKNTAVAFAACQYTGDNPVTGAKEYRPLDFAQFRYKEATRTFTLKQDQTIVLVAGSIVSKVVEGITLTPFEKVPATPATPELIYAQIDSQWSGIEFNLYCKDVDGNFIDSASLTWSVFIDDELYTFEPGIYAIFETISEFPYEYNDYNGGTDIYCNGNNHRVFIYGELFETIGVEAYYTVDGDRRTSERLNFTTNSIDGITTLMPIVETTYFDLNGRRIDNPDNGLYIRVDRFEDGSVKHSKKMIRK